MPKRLTATEKWEDEWFLALSNDKKVVWLYMLDKCTIAGRFKKNLKMLNFCCQTNFKEDEIPEIFNKRVVDMGDFFFIPKFLKFQNPTGLSSNKPAVKAIRKEIEEYGLKDLIITHLGNDYLMIKQSLGNDHRDMHMHMHMQRKKGECEGKKGETLDKVRQIVRYLNETAGTKFSDNAASTIKVVSARLAEGRTIDEMKQVVEKKVIQWLENPKMAKYIRPITLFNGEKFESYLHEVVPEGKASRKYEAFKKLWAEYPLKVGENEAFESFSRTVKVDDDYRAVNRALRHYLQSRRVKQGYVMNGSKWFADWFSWVNPQDQPSQAETDEVIMREAGFKSV